MTTDERFAGPSEDRFPDAPRGFANEIVEGRRVSAYFVPIPATKKQGRQLPFGTEWTVPSRSRSTVRRSEKSSTVPVTSAMRTPRSFQTSSPA